MVAFVYMLRCADGSYYVGFTQRPPDERLAIHQAGVVKGYTSTRLPVEMVWCAEFALDVEAFSVERQIKGWSRAKKEALISGNVGALKLLARRRAGRPFVADLRSAPQGDRE